MADAVRIDTILQTRDRVILKLTNRSDGSGETNVKKADKSDYLARDGAEPANLDFEWLDYDIQGFASVDLIWDHGTDVRAFGLSGKGYKDFRGVDRATKDNVLHRDPSSDGTGDILLSAVGGASGSTYEITICLFKRQ